MAEVRMLNSNLDERSERDYRSCSNGMHHGPLGTRPVATWVDVHGIYWCDECMNEIGADPNGAKRRATLPSLLEACEAEREARRG